LNPFHVPVGVMLDERSAEEPMYSLQHLRWFPCLVGAKSDAQVICIDEAVKYPNVNLLTRSEVKRLETDTSGREVNGVVVERNGSLETYSADMVVVSCGHQLRACCCAPPMTGIRAG